MTELLRYLEPIQYEPHTVILYELEEFGQIFFKISGCVIIGLSINKKAHYVLKKENNFQVGAFGVTFNQRCRYIYKTFREQSQGYFIRKEHWTDLLSGPGSEFKEFTKNLKKNILLDYMVNIRSKLEVARNQMIEEFK